MRKFKSKSAKKKENLLGALVPNDSPVLLSILLLFILLLQVPGVAVRTRTRMSSIKEKKEEKLLQN